MRYRAILLFGAPGAGKGTQGKILGTIPGFYHLACGDVFRGLDWRTPLGKAFLDYSTKGNLVPDDLTMDLWSDTVQKNITTGHFKPEIDRIVLDGIPRNVNQAKLLEAYVTVERVFHLNCPDLEKMVERMRRRALKDNRVDDASETVIRNRLETYVHETKPVLDFYGPDLITNIDSTLYPFQVLREILQSLSA
jgi:adenylate kinase